MTSKGSKTRAKAKSGTRAQTASYANVTVRSPDTDDDTSTQQTISEHERSTEEIESSKDLLPGDQPLNVPNMKDISRYSLPANVKQNSMLDAKRKGFKARRTTAVMSHLQMPGSMANQYGLEHNSNEIVPFYSQAFFQQYKRRRGFGQREPTLSEAGEIHTYKR